MILCRKYNGAKNLHRSFRLLLVAVVGERSRCVEGIPTRSAGTPRSEYAGMSNDKMGENPIRRKPKVSYAMFVIVGLVGT